MHNRPSAVLCAVLLAAAQSITADEFSEASSTANAGARDDVLIVANANFEGSLEVARHYAAARGIADNRIVAIRSPASYTIDWDQFEILRDQIVDFLLRETLALGAEPPSCGNGERFYCEEKLAQIRNRTTIRYVVLVRGVPTRFVPAARNFRLSTLPTTVDSYLRYHLLNHFPENNAADPLRFPEGRNRERDFADGRGMRTIDPARDREFAIGRIDGVTTQAAKDLIDRTLSAEANGIYGKLYTNTFRHPNPALDAIISPEWTDEQTGLPVYGSVTTNEGGTSWRYQMGLWGAPPECAEHLRFGPNQPAGLSPEECPVRINDPVDAPPGSRGSRIADVVDAIVYLGALDGQSTTGTDGSLDVLARWKTGDGECPLLCADLPAPDERAQCRAASLDAMREFNSSCVAVNEGFIGYNWVSWPLSYFAVWPTAWAPVGDSPGDWANGDLPLDLPRVRTDEGHADRFSLWFGALDETASTGCFARNGFLGPESATVPCANEHRFRIGQRIDLSARPIRPGRPGSPRSLSLVFWVKSDDGFGERQLESIEAYVALHQSNGRVVPLRPIRTGELGPTPSWTRFSLELDIDPARHADCLDADCAIESMALHLQSGRASGTFAGTIGLDDIELRLGSDPRNLLANSPFDEGFRQLAIGDHAAVFLNRLGGVAFWGSAGHAVTGGHSFASHPVETLIYFLRGLPLGEAVWLHEELPTGILYGDPLYSPVAVKIDYEPGGGTGDRYLDLFATAVNGRNPDFVDTVAEVDFCEGGDWFDCDRDGSWQRVQLADGAPSPGGGVPGRLGRWDISGLPPAEYSLRLRVTSTNVNSASRSHSKTQTFVDYRIVPSAEFRLGR